MAVAPAVPFNRRRHSAPRSLARPHVCLGSPPPPCRLTINPAVTMATVPMHASSQFLEVRWGYSAESRVKCCPNDLGREQNKCEGEASCLCIWVESWKLGVERSRGEEGRREEGRRKGGGGKGGRKEGLSSPQDGCRGLKTTRPKNIFCSHSAKRHKCKSKNYKTVITLLLWFPAIWQA